MKRVLIVHDLLKPHPSADELDTVHEIEQVRAALAGEDFEIQSMAFSLNFDAMARATRGADCLFNLTETLCGSSLLYLPPLYFEQLKQKFTGVDSTGMYLTSDKLLTKKMLQLNHIPCPDSISIDDLSNAKNFLNRPLILKPVNQEASVGINDQSVRIFRREMDLREALSSSTEQYFAEDFIDGREFNISVILEDGKPVVLPPAEMKFVDFPEGKPKIVGYEAKWSESSFEYTHTRRCFDFEEGSAALLKSLQELCRKIYTLFCKKGYIRCYQSTRVK